MRNLMIYNLTKKEAEYLVKFIAKEAKEKEFNVPMFRKRGWTVTIKKEWNLTNYEIFRCFLHAIYFNTCDFSDTIADIPTYFINEIYKFIRIRFIKGENEYETVRYVKNMMSEFAKDTFGGILLYLQMADKWNGYFDMVCEMIEEYAQGAGYERNDFFPELESLIWTAERVLELKNSIKIENEDGEGCNTFSAEYAAKSLILDYPERREEIIKAVLKNINEIIKEEEFKALNDMEMTIIINDLRSKFHKEENLYDDDDGGEDKLFREISLKLETPEPSGR